MRAWTSPGSGGFLSESPWATGTALPRRTHQLELRLGGTSRSIGLTTVVCSLPDQTKLEEEVT
jgi:hypothetical protein